MKQVPEVREKYSREDMNYGEYMEKLRTELPVSSYMLDPRTAIVAIAAMFVMAVLFYFLLPLVMFRSLTLVAWLAVVVVFLALTWVYYDYVYYPNEVEGAEGPTPREGGD